MYKSRGFHKTFNKDGIPLLLKGSKSHQNKNRVNVKYVILLLLKKTQIQIYDHSSRLGTGQCDMLWGKTS